jgi:hypothetical protein
MPKGKPNDSHKMPAVHKKFNKRPTKKVLLAMDKVIEAKKSEELAARV